MILHYGDYEGSVEYDCDDHIYYGKVLNTPHLISYMGTTWEDVIVNFMEAVGDYMEEEPDLVPVNIPLDVIKKRLRKK